MKIQFDLSHPAHVHLYRNFIQHMMAEGHEVRVTARDKEVTTQLLEAHGIPYERVGVMQGDVGMARAWMARERRIIQIAREFRPDLVMGTLNPAVAHAAAVIRKPAIIFTDFEPSSIRYPIEFWLTRPFRPTFLLPTAVRHDYGRRSVKLPTFKELAYLHPSVFQADPAIRDELGVGADEPFAVLRFVAWKAHHDVGAQGLSAEAKAELAGEIAKRMRVFVSTEGPLPEQLEQYRLPTRPERMHHVLAEASLLVCDSQTMATEAAILGTPAVRSNSFVGDTDMGNFHELENEYGLLHNLADPAEARAKAIELAEDPGAKSEWLRRRQRLLAEKLDLTAFLKWFVDGFPATLEQAKDPRNLEAFR